MQDGKKIVMIVILVVVIVGAVVFLVRKYSGEPERPEWLDTEAVQRIDVESQELVTKTVGEWEKLGHRDQKYKNPSTDKYTMVVPISCSSCGETIPPPEVPVFEPPPGGPNTPDAIEAVAKSSRLIQEIRSSYKCPNCGDPAIMGR